MTPPPGLLLAGEVGKPHGIAGEVYVVRISDDPARFDPGAILVREDGSELVVERARPHRDRFLVKFEGCETRSEAERLRGPLYVSGHEVRHLEDDEYWQHDLVGLDVVTAGGEHVGEVSAIVSNPAQDLIEVATPRGERLIPFVDAIVRDVSLEERRIVVDPPQGLLD